MRVNINANPLILLLLAAALAYAGMSNLDSLTLKPAASGDNALVVQDSSGNNKLVISGSGVISTLDATLEDDITLKGSGVDILFDTADQNEIGSDAAPAEKLWTNELDVEDVANFAADVTLTGSGIDLLFTTANQNSIGAAATGAKEVFTRALTGETGSVLTLSAGSGIAISSPTTPTADMTFSGSGVDILFNAANQNSIGAAAKGAKEVFTRAVTGETGTALTISAASGITNSAVNTMTGGGVVLTATAAPAQTASTSAGLLWLHDATANNGCGGPCTDNKLYCFINGSWTVLH